MWLFVLSPLPGGQGAPSYATGARALFLWAGEGTGFQWGFPLGSHRRVLRKEGVPRALTLHLEENLALCLVFGYGELAAQGPAVVLPGQDHMEGLLVADTRGLELLVVGGDRASGVLALPLQVDGLLQARVGSGAVEVGLHALAKLQR